MKITLTGKGESIVQFVSSLHDLLGVSVLIQTIEQTPSGDFFAQAVIESFDGGSKTPTGSEPQQTT